MVASEEGAIVDFGEPYVVFLFPRTFSSVKSDIGNHNELQFLEMIVGEMRIVCSIHRGLRFCFMFYSSSSFFFFFFFFFFWGGGGGGCSSPTNLSTKNSVCISQRPEQEANK